MLKINKTTLKNLEELLKNLGYKIRYEKGQFQAGYCLVKQQKVIVINKFYTTEVRINTLLDIFNEIGAEEEVVLEASQQAFYEKVMKTLDQQTETVDTKDF